MNSLDEVFGLFNKERRRFALYYLDQADGAVSIEELAKQIAKWEENSQGMELPDDEFRDVIISLEHSHLPAIDDAECIELDREGNQIEITGMDSDTSLILNISESIEGTNGPADISVSDLV